MSKTKQNKDYRNITLEDAVQWTVKNCMMDDVRKRLMSRAVAYVLAAQLKYASELIVDLVAENERLNKELELRVIHD